MPFVCARVLFLILCVIKLKICVQMLYNRCHGIGATGSQRQTSPFHQAFLGKEFVVQINLLSEKLLFREKNLHQKKLFNTCMYTYLYNSFVDTIVCLFVCLYASSMLSVRSCQFNLVSSTLSVRFHLAVLAYSDTD